MKKRITLMIADDHIMFREGLKYLLERDDLFKIIAEAGDGEECINILSELSPDVLLLDLNMPNKNGFDVLSELNKNQNSNIKVLILTFHSELDHLLKAIEIGIDGYILKSSHFDELKKAILSILDGNKYIQSDLLEELNSMDQKLENDCDKIKRLTKRELDVLKHLSFGMYNKEIATKLEISERTVKNHVSNIFKKVGVADRTQAAVFAIRNHLININD